MVRRELDGTAFLRTYHLTLSSSEIQALTLLPSLPESWTGVVISVSDSMVKDETKLDDVKDLLLGEEIIRVVATVLLHSMLNQAEELKGKMKDKKQDRRLEDLERA